MLELSTKCFKFIVETKFNFKMVSSRELPGGPVVRTRRFHYAVWPKINKIK